MDVFSARNLPTFLAQLSECLDGAESVIFARTGRFTDFFTPVILLPGWALHTCRLMNLLPSMVDPGVLGFGFDGGKIVKVVELGERSEFFETEDLAGWEELTEA